MSREGPREDTRASALAMLIGEILAMLGALQLVEGSRLLGVALMVVGLVLWSTAPHETQRARRAGRTESEADRLQRRPTHEESRRSA